MHRTAGVSDITLAIALFPGLAIPQGYQRCKYSSNQHGYSGGGDFPRDVK